MSGEQYNLYNIGGKPARRMRNLMSVNISLLCAVSCVMSSVITKRGKEGGNSSIQCPYDRGFETNQKYLSKGIWAYRVDVIKTQTHQHPAWTHEGRFSLYDDTERRVFTVTITNLIQEDSGTYCCEINTWWWYHKTEVRITVDRAPVPPNPGSVTSRPLLSTTHPSTNITMTTDSSNSTADRTNGTVGTTSPPTDMTRTQGNNSIITTDRTRTQGDVMFSGVVLGVLGDVMFSGVGLGVLGDVMFSGVGLGVLGDVMFSGVVLGVLGDVMFSGVGLGVVLLLLGLLLFMFFRQRRDRDRRPTASKHSARLLVSGSMTTNQDPDTGTITNPIYATGTNHNPDTACDINTIYAKATNPHPDDIYSNVGGGEDPDSVTYATDSDQDGHELQLFVSLV
ncbi:uncharacterized protein LOC129839231 [Salvelinus fontinalis]|uniref:uncharacterized protein LOC129839231 n=1 Tax=Salvelinus fontinalis TaxID=8038 RepID=UPI002485FC39|nr:uncharacterized protein LOC129839231 [Salvelinus fontinalis]